MPERPAVDVGAFAKFALPLIRAATPRLVARDLTEGTWAVENETDPKPEPSE